MCPAQCYDQLHLTNFEHKLIVGEFGRFGDELRETFMCLQKKTFTIITSEKRGMLSTAVRKFEFPFEPFLRCCRRFNFLLAERLCGFEVSDCNQLINEEVTLRITRRLSCKSGD